MHSKLHLCFSGLLVLSTLHFAWTHYFVVHFFIQFHTFLEDDTVVMTDEEYHPDVEEQDGDEEAKQPESKDAALTPTQEQLSDISFETNRTGRFAAILVDGAKYR